MKLLIFGATGTIGKHLVLQALEKGHIVTAFARNRNKLDDIRHPNLHIQEGDVLNGLSVENAVHGQEIVLCALGAGRKGSVRSKGTQQIIAAMKKAGVKRFICQTTLGAGDSHRNLNFFWKHIMFGWFLKEAFLDHELQEKYIRESNLDWTIIRPGAFTDGMVSGNYKHGFSPDDRTISLKISRADVAHFMLAQVTSTEYLRKTPGLSY